MPSNSKIRAGGSFAWRLAAFYSTLFAVLGVQMPFLPVWFAAKDLEAASVGLALAIPLIVRPLAIPIATRIADSYASARTVIIVGAVATFVGYAVVGLMQSPLAIMAAVALASLFYAPLMPLTDAYALRGLGLHGRSYGPVRLWGSAAFIAGSLGGGLLLDVIAPRKLIWVVVGALGLNAAASCTLAPLDEKTSPVSPQRRAASALLRDARFWLLAMAAAFIQASHAIYYGFSALQWRSAGLDGTTIGGLWALGVLAEIAMFAASPRLPLGPRALLVAGATGAVVRWGAMAFGPSPGALLPLQCLHALSFGATHLGAIGFVARVAPEGQGASAQGYLAVILALAMAGAMAVSGELYARWGGRAYAGMALLALTGGLFILLGSVVQGTNRYRAPK
jgi:PPP family 3-phenylpropionic acid transporter